MCDDQTEADNEIYLEKIRMRRRELSLGAGAAMTTWVVGCGPATAPAQSSVTPGTDPASETEQPASADAPADADALATEDRMVTVQTPDGEAEAFFVTPSEGRHPGVLMWPDIAGLRDAFKTMATRLAGRGYAVLAVNPYYRSSTLPVLETFSEWGTEQGRAKIIPMVEALSEEGIAKDGAAFVAWLDQQAPVDPARKIGTTGYCMSGSFTFRTAAAAPERVGVIGSFHGGGLVTKEPDSPHALFSKMKAAALICIADNDHARQPEAQSALQQAAEAAGTPAEVEVYAAQHGWCVIDSPVYDQEQAERAWSRMLATFEQHL